MNRLDRPRRRLAVALAALAGYVDAIGFISAGGYFTSFMSGNTTRLGVDLVAASSTAMIPALLIAGFVIGVALGALLADRAGARRKSAVLLLTLVLLVAAAMLRERWLAGFLGVSVLAMGVLNNVFRRDGEVTLGVTYMTGALVRFGQGLAARLSGQADRGGLSAGALWLGLATGAVCGAVVLMRSTEAAAWVAAGYTGVLLIAARTIERDGEAPR